MYGSSLRVAWPGRSGTIRAMSRYPTLRPIRFIALVCLLLALPACVRPGPRPIIPPEATTIVQPTPPSIDPTSAAPLSGQLGTPVPDYTGQPTPDAPHYEVAAGTTGTSGSHTVAAGESLGTIATRYNTTVADLVALNDLANPDIITPGQQLQVPGVEIQRVVGPEFKILPDSELVYGCLLYTSRCV